MPFYDTISRWNLWGSWKLPDSYPRDMTDEICRYCDVEETIALIGPRRAGKSTVLYQIMNFLLARGVDQKAILHINFEEPGLSPYLKLALLDKIYDLYRSRVFPKGKAYIFLDEIQNVPQWERWVRARNDTEDIKVFITGSSSALLSGELATVLTGRNFTFDIYPLSFSEILAFKNITLPPFYSHSPPAEIKHALIEYLTWGGFPRVVLASNDDERERLLKRYFDEVLFKDVAQRHEIRNVTALRNIAVHMLTNTASLTSYKRMGEIFQVSADLAQVYAHHLSEALLLKQLPFYSLKTSERTRNPFKTHTIDLGFREVVSLSRSRDNGKLLETQVHNTLLRRKQDGLFYWKEKGEIDLLVQEGITITHLYQVAYEGLDDPKVLRREIRALDEAGSKFPDATKHLITWEAPDNLENVSFKNIELVPLWHFLLA